jgi:hypothetical protein
LRLQLPFVQPEAVLTGRSIYRVDPSTGNILQHIDMFDAVQVCTAACTH